MYQFLVYCFIFCLELVHSLTNEGVFRLKNENMKFIGASPLASKETRSLVECQLFCQQHKTECFSINFEIISEEKSKCEIFKGRKNYGLHPDQFEAATNTSYYIIHNYEFLPTSCKEWYEIGFKKSGVYKFHQTGNKSPITSFYCDMDSIGGPWLVIQQRGVNSMSFDKTVDQYENGFGSLEGDRWIGLEKIHLLTKNKPVDLLIFAEADDAQFTYGRYSNFAIASKLAKYQLNGSLSHTEGTAGFEQLAGTFFSHTVYDKDFVVDKNCAANRQCGWWFGDTCLPDVSLNDGDLTNTKWNTFLPLDPMMGVPPKIVKTKMAIKV